MSFQENEEKNQQGCMVSNENSMLVLDELNTNNNTHGLDVDDNENNKPKKRASRRRMSVPHNVNQQFLQQFQQNLDQNQIEHLRKASQEFRCERDLKHTMVKLQEKEDQCRTAIEIIGNLEKQNEEFAHTIENLKNQLTNSSNENRILEQKFQAVNDSYDQEKKEFESILKEKEDKIQELLHDIHNNNNDNDMQMQFNNNDNLDKNKQNKNESSSKVENEKALSIQFEEEKQKVNERDMQIESMLQQLEDYRRVQQEFDDLKEEFNKYQELAQQDLTQQSVTSKAIEKELIELASRNSAIENEKQDLMDILEQRDYEIVQLKSLIDLSKSHNRNASGVSNKMGIDEVTYRKNTLDMIMNENGDERNDENENTNEKSNQNSNVNDENTTQNNVVSIDNVVSVDNVANVDDVVDVVDDDDDDDDDEDEEEEDDEDDENHNENTNENSKDTSNEYANDHSNANESSCDTTHEVDDADEIVQNKENNEIEDTDTNKINEDKNVGVETTSPNGNVEMNTNANPQIDIILDTNVTEITNTSMNKIIATSKNEDEQEKKHESKNEYEYEYEIENENVDDHMSLKLNEDVNEDTNVNCNENFNVDRNLNTNENKNIVNDVENENVKKNEMDNVIVDEELVTNENEHENENENAKANVNMSMTRNHNETNDKDNVDLNTIMHNEEKIDANKIKNEDPIGYKKDIDNKMDAMRNDNPKHVITSSDITHVSVIPKGYSRLREEKRRTEVPHVMKEYLHLTASIVKTKFPNINTISSEQLIEKVQDLSICDYYDMMMRIMKNEQMKLHAQTNVTNSSSSNFFTKFREFFSLHSNDDTTRNENELNIQPNANSNNEENQHLDEQNGNSKNKDGTEKRQKSKKKDKISKHEKSKSKSKSKSKQYEQSNIEENEKTGYNSNYYTLTIDPKYFEQSGSKSLSKSNHHEDGNRVNEIEKSGDQFNHNKNNKKDKNTSNIENLEFQSVVSEW